jgi:hypothetical protein
MLQQICEENYYTFVRETIWKRNLIYNYNICERSLICNCSFEKKNCCNICEKNLIYNCNKFYERNNYNICESSSLREKLNL